MNEAKISLSQKEMDLVTNADWILTKNAILEKVKNLLATLSQSFQAHIESYPLLIPAGMPKISKGENYKGLPYLILDYPRSFEKEDILAIRTMFWWGHFFSITLHVAGKNKLLFGEKIIRAYASLAARDCAYCVHEEQWEHHFEPDNYRSIQSMTEDEFETAIRQSPFVKLAMKFALTEWVEIPVILRDSFEYLIYILKD